MQNVYDCIGHYLPTLEKSLGIFGDGFDLQIVGYSMAIAKTRRSTLTVVGAPRHNHIGIVMAVTEWQTRQIIDPSRWQVSCSL